VANTYVFRFGSSAGTRWQREFNLSGDHEAKLEGSLLLENQATTQAINGTVSVLRLEGDDLTLVGSWSWRDGAAEWSDGGAAS
jgi:hypothetical protein